MRLFSRGVLSALLLVMLFTVCGLAQSYLPEGVYRLTDEAYYQHGCWPPCYCPMFAPDPLLGTFTLTRSDSSYTRWPEYDVSAVNWVIESPDGPVMVTGSGVYRLRRSGGWLQRLEMDLRVGEEPLTHYDSGWVPADASGELGIYVTIAMNGFYCYDQVFHVAAVPVPDTALKPYTLGSHSLYQYGCWPPCECVLHEPQPVRGTFYLLELGQNPLYKLYAVIRVEWAIDEFPPPGEGKVTGAGFYKNGGEFVPQHQLTLMLSFDEGEPLLFDSGLVTGGNDFPRIDIDISRNGFYCYDQAFFLDAYPLNDTP